MIERNVTGHEFHRALLERLRQEPDALYLERALAQIRMPTLILWCQRDRLLDFSSIDVLRRGLTNASKVEVEVFEPCSHMPMMEQPVPVAERLARFYKEAGSPRATP
jgi:pimeloyl-ACP methyl ester carboxylesterase